jgi:hypothetical protein
VGLSVEKELTPRQAGTNPRAKGTNPRASLPEFDRQRFMETWNAKANRYGLPRIKGISTTIENGLKRLWKSHIKQCKEQGRETREPDTLFNGYIEFGYEPTDWARGNNPEGKRFGIDTALTQKKIDEILNEVGA